MSNFQRNWENKKDESIGDKIKTAVKPDEPLKRKLEQAIRLIQIQIAKLDGTASKLKEKDQKYFEKVVSYLQKHDNERANIYATELAEIRKMYKMLTQAKLALEQISTRLSTATELGDVVAVLDPAMKVLTSIRRGVSNVMPAAEDELGEISTLLNNIMVDAGQISSSGISFEPTNDEAESILSQASAVAEARMKQTLPDISGLGLGAEGSKQ
ncbi:MAG: Snf7 family protein [Nitrososphaeria archaeon]|jgi:division protein CdvB (Snf7/Vps24/ESCRT-III family)